MKKCQKCKRQSVQKTNVQKTLSNDTFEYTGKIVNGLTETELRHEMSFPVNNEKELKKIMDLNKWSLISTNKHINCLLYTSPSPRDQRGSRMPSSA